MRSQQEEHSPFTYLLSLEETLRRSAKGLAYHELKSSDWVGVVFLSGNYVLVVPLEEVSEIVQVQVLAPIPGVKLWLRGMTTTHGELFPVTDLAGFLSQKVSLITNHSRVLVISYQEEYSGLLVDRVLGLHKIPPENRGTKPSIVIPEYEQFIIGSYISDNLELPIISCKAILQYPPFRDVALRGDEMSEVGGSHGF